MKNLYMFFNAQSFENLDLNDYQRTDIPIRQTQACIYEFRCIQSDSNCDDETQAKMLDSLTYRLSEKYPNSFQIICSESSQFFCRQLYSLIVELETKLRQALYVSRILYEKGSVTPTSFLFTIGKEEKSIEELDFGEIYDAIFTDQGFKKKVLKEYDRNLTKNDLVKIIQKMEEDTLWRKMVGSDYSYIENHFLQIKDFRNDIMHNHLINFATYVEARKILNAANEELGRSIRDKLITNSSEYLNAVNIIESISNFMTGLQLVATRLDRFANSEGMAKFLKLFVDAGSVSDNLTQLPDAKLEDQEDENNA